MTALSLVTVVHRGELPLLRLQARSLARHAAADDVAEVLVAVNDSEERAVLRAVEAMRAEWGPHAAKLRVRGGRHLFWGRAGAAGEERRRWAAKLRRRRASGAPFGPSGWHGHEGWWMQQAFKLAAARALRGGNVLILDAKNVLLGALDPATFFAPDGRAKGFLIDAPDHLHREWLAWTRHALGLSERAVGMSPVTSYRTPFAVRRADLRGALDWLETRTGEPVETHFSTGWPRCSEFMLLNAWAATERGGVDAVFAPGLPEPASLHAEADEAEIAALLRGMESGRLILPGLHVVALARLDAARRARLAAVLARAGVVETPEDAEAAFAEAMAGNRARIDARIAEMDARRT